MTKRTDGKKSGELPAVPSEISSLRERVRQHMRKMAPLALVAAAPLTNTACDPVQQPICSQSSDQWLLRIGATSSWGEEGGVTVIVLKLTSSHVTLPTAYAVEGGTLVALTPGPPLVLKLRPDPGATRIVLTGTLDCEGRTGPLAVTVDLTPGDGGNPDAGPLVTIGTP